MDTVAFKYSIPKQNKKVDVKIVMLENGGHYPVEQPALDQMHDAIVEFIYKVTK